MVFFLLTHSAEQQLGPSTCRTGTEIDGHSIEQPVTELGNYDEIPSALATRWREWHQLYSDSKI